MSADQVVIGEYTRTPPAGKTGLFVSCNFDPWSDSQNLDYWTNTHTGKHYQWTGTQWELIDQLPPEVK